MEQLVDDDRLGRLVSVHPVTVVRRWRSGGAALAIGLGGALLLGCLIGIAPSGGSGRPLLLGLVPMACGLPIAVLQLTRAVRGGRQETFELYEQGVGRRASGGHRTWTWGAGGRDPDEDESRHPPAPPRLGPQVRGAIHRR